MLKFNPPWKGLPLTFKTRGKMRGAGVWEFEKFPSPYLNNAEVWSFHNKEDFSAIVVVGLRPEMVHAIEEAGLFQDDYSNGIPLTQLGIAPPRWLSVVVDEGGTEYALSSFDSLEGALVDSARLASNNRTLEQVLAAVKGRRGWLSYHGRDVKSGTEVWK